MLVKGEYLGSTYSILLVRNTQDYSGEVSILCNEFINGIDGKKQYQVKSSASIPNIFISNLSLCGIPRLRKTYLVAVGSTFTSSASSSSNSSVGSQGVIQFLEVQSEKGSTIISPVASPKCDDATHFTDCTYQLDGEQLAVVNESGDLFLIDTSTGTYLHSLKADSSLKKVRYFPDSSMIATMSGSAMKIWDLRAPPSPSLSFSPEPIHHLRSLKNQHSPVQSNLASTPRSKALSISPPSLACFVCHASEPKIFLGDNRGAVNLWDYRMTSPMSRENQLEYTPHNAAGILTKLLKVSEF